MVSCRTPLASRSLFSSPPIACSSVRRVAMRRVSSIVLRHASRISCRQTTGQSCTFSLKKFYRDSCGGGDDERGSREGAGLLAREGSGGGRAPQREVDLPDHE